MYDNYTNNLQWCFRVVQDTNEGMTVYLYTGSQNENVF